MKKILLIPFFVLFALKANAQVPSRLDITNEVTETQKFRSLKMTQNSSLNFFIHYQQYATNMTFNTALSNVFIYEPQDSPTWSQTVNGSFQNQANGICKVPFRSTNTATNGTFYFVHKVMSNNVIVARTIGQIILDRMAGVVSTNSFPTPGTLGDTYYFSGSVLALSIGSAGQIFTVSTSGIPSWTSGGLHGFLTNGVNVNAGSNFVVKSGNELFHYAIDRQ